MKTTHIAGAHHVNDPHKNDNLPENITRVLYYDCYKKGLRSTKEINEKLTEHYHTPIEMEMEQICAILKKRSRMFAFRKRFDPKEITE
jgi:hypothetical protein